MWIRGPRNRFPLVEAEEYLFIAGGIGITPLLPMLRQATRSGARWSLVYGGRSVRSMPFHQELGEFGTAVRLVSEEDEGRPDLEAALRAVGAGTRVYCCGPLGLIESGERLAVSLGLELHSELFAPGGTSAGPEERLAFELELARSGRSLEVSESRSVLDTVRTALPDVASSCEEGFCGTCETTVLEGIPDHRDSILDEDERSAGRSMMICVSRSRTPRLVLDL